MLANMAASTAVASQRPICGGLRGLILFGGGEGGEGGEESGLGGMVVLYGLTGRRLERFFRILKTALYRLVFASWAPCPAGWFAID